MPLSGLSSNFTLSWELACQWYGAYTREEFFALPGDSQARIVALYLIHTRTEAVIAKSIADEAKRNG